MTEKLQKILARAGYGSRRACEELIRSGRVRVDGRVATIGDRADANVSAITLDEVPVRGPETLTYIALYKPRNVISSVDDPVGRRTVNDLVPRATHLHPVGRLDWDSEGLVLMTNDGALTNVLTHPRYGHTKEYRVLLARLPAPESLQTWRRGVVLDDGYRTAPADVRVESRTGKGAWVRVVMGEGRRRQIRETGQILGLPVVRIIRVRIASLKLGALKPGQWRFLDAEEVRALRATSSQSSERRRPSPQKRSGTGAGNAS